MNREPKFYFESEPAVCSGGGKDLRSTPKNELRKDMRYIKRTKFAFAMYVISIISHNIAFIVSHTLPIVKRK